MFNSEFNSLAKYPDVDIYHEDLRAEIDAVNEWVYPGINDGVYRCGFATKQGAYETAFKYGTQLLFFTCIIDHSIAIYSGPIALLRIAT